MVIYVPRSTPVPDTVTRLPVALVVDASYAMRGDIMDELRVTINALGALFPDYETDGIETDFCTIHCHDRAEIVQPFGSEPDPNAMIPVFAEGSSSVNQGIGTALDMLEERMRFYRENGMESLRPLLLLFTDGAATDTCRGAAAVSRLRRAIAAEEVRFFPMGAGPGTDAGKLRQYYPEDVESKPVLSAHINSIREILFHLGLVTKAPAPAEAVPKPAAEPREPGGSEPLELPPVPVTITLPI